MCQELLIERFFQKTGNILTWSGWDISYLVIRSPMAIVAYNYNFTFPSYFSNENKTFFYEMDKY